jgi:hypothetical protein
LGGRGAQGGNQNGLLLFVTYRVRAVQYEMMCVYRKGPIVHRGVFFFRGVILTVINGRMSRGAELFSIHWSRVYMECVYVNIYIKTSMYIVNKTWFSVNRLSLRCDPATLSKKDNQIKKKSESPRKLGKFREDMNALTVIVLVHTGLHVLRSFFYFDLTIS